ncbi:hypothetical protein DFO66_11048 [Brevibacterium sanguinis]|uniref:DUF4190 domain-containing protein n=2 Tax=Brevibacterium TaxID=1696 RepID=A0A366IEU2_9MICO|nr:MULTISPECIES: DUF4190 domain-containing protein [Brevibacterium]RBP63425.1 hypothetical protein DFO66_11048 [Brevibacterium sanguinis]RBP69892.1 hypothetical protein DFO65_11048 [Brevibacterium celere]
MNQRHDQQAPYSHDARLAGDSRQFGDDQQFRYDQQIHSEPLPPRSHPAAPGRAADDPGRVLGIVSLVATLSTFLGFSVLGPIVGIITGWMARNSSRQAGFADNEMGKWGFILGIVFVSLAALGALLGISIGAFAGLFGLLSA